MSKVSVNCLRGQPVPAALRALWLASEAGDTALLDACEDMTLVDDDQKVRDFLETPDVEEHVVRAYRRMFDQFAVIAAEADGGLLGYWLHSPEVTIADAPIVRLDNEGQFQATAATLEDHFVQAAEGEVEQTRQIRAWFEERGIKTQASGPSVWAKINDLLEPNQRSWEFQAEEKAGKKPPRRSARAPVAPRPDDDSSDPARLLGKSAQDPEVKAFIAKNAATDRLRKASGVEVKIDGDGRLATIWLTAGKTASSVVTRGVRLGMSQPEMTAVLGQPTRRGASWERFDDQTVALHLELKEGEVVRLTLMWRASMPPSLR